MISVHGLVGGGFCLLLWAESCNTFTGYMTKGKHIQIGLAVIITPPTITVTLVLAHKDAASLTQSLLIVTVLSSAHPACVLVSRSPLVQIWAQMSCVPFTLRKQLPPSLYSTHQKLVATESHIRLPTQVWHLSCYRLRITINYGIRVNFLRH